LTRVERGILALLCLFSVKFFFSAAARFLPALQTLDAVGSGRNPVDVWLLLLSCTAVLGTACLYRRAVRAMRVRFTRFDWLLLGLCCIVSAAFYLSRMWGRQTLYLWDNATYYNLQVRLESNFADGVFIGVGSTVYKTWFNDYAPLVINLLAEPFFMFTDRTANTFVMICAVGIPSLVYAGALVLLCVLRRCWTPRAPRLFTALGMALTLFFPLLHIALYRGMPDLLGVAFALMLLALGAEYRFEMPAFTRLVCMAAFTGLLMLTRRCYMFWVAAYFVLYGLGVLLRAIRQKQPETAKRLLKFAGLSLLFVGGPLLPMFWRIVGQNYADRYATYQTGGFWAEVQHQGVFLGGLLGAVLLVGTVYGLWRKKARPAAVLALLGAPLTLFLITRVQNMDDHQSLAVAPFYLLGFYLLALGVADLKFRRLIAGVLALCCAANFGANAMLMPVVFPSSVHSGTWFWLDAQREDFDEIGEVNDWLRANCEGENSAYMICHGILYSPDVFRAMALPDESIRSILPYGACNPGNDAFPLGLFTARAVLTCTPFDPNNHTEKLNAAFLENQEKYQPFVLDTAFDMGNGTTIEAYLRVKPVTKEEIATYRAWLQEEDAQFPYNFSAVLDAFEAQLPG